MLKDRLRYEDVFPAYAGMSRTDEHQDRRRSRFPRLRGDEPVDPGTEYTITEFSPPTRG